MTTLITGGSGRLGQELVKVVPDALTPTRDVLDVTDRDSIARYLHKNPVATIIHAAALTDIRYCQNNYLVTEQVNVAGTFNMVAAAAMIGAKLVFISTACVFDGEMAPYSEADRPCPKNHYALTKYAAEQIVRQFPGNLIVRTNFVPYAPWPYPAAFSDRYGTYLFAHDVANALPGIMDLTGIVHLCGDRAMSMYELAKMVSPEVRPITIDEYNGPPVTRDMRLVSVRIPPVKITVPG